MRSVRTTQTELIFRLAASPVRSIYPMPTPKKAAPETPSANLCNPTPHSPRWSAKTYSPDRTDQKALGLHPQTRAPGSQGKAQYPRRRKTTGGIRRQEDCLMFEMTKLVNGHL